MQNWMREILSEDGKLSSTRSMLILTTLFVIVSSSLLFIFDAFTADKGWFLVSFASLAWGGKSLAKFKERPGRNNYDN